MTTFLIFDTETTGLLAPSVSPLDKQPRIIELAVLRVNGADASSASWLINPGVPISAEITKITGLTDADLKDKPTFAQLLPEIRQWFDGADFGVAHNAPFDTGMLRTELALAACADFPWPGETLCTVQEYRHLLGERAKLTVLYELLTGKPLKQTHRAMDDVMALHEALAADNFFSKVEGYWR